jgi:ATP-dependent Clp protease protease subunit
MSSSSSETIIDIKTELNEIHFNGPICEQSMSKLINNLLTMEIGILKKKKNLKRKIRTFEKEVTDDSITNLEIKINPKAIKLYITSGGGSVYQVFSAIDTIKQMKVPVYTICKGIVASAGTLLSLSGTRRFITKNSYMLIHELRTVSWGKFSFIKDNFENCTNLMEHIKDYYITNTKLTKEELDVQLVKDIIWNATICLEKGLVDEII